MNDENVITLENENGRELKFKFLDLISYRQKDYVVLLPLDNSDGRVAPLTVDVAILEVDYETDSCIGVKNESVLEAVASLFKERVIDFYNRRSN